MDSFEANSQFEQLVRGLNPSIQSLKRAAVFAIKNWENEDYLFPTIMGVLNDESTELNTKSTLFHFIEVLISESFQVSQLPNSNYSYPYINSLKEALPEIILRVIPGTANYNMYNVFNSLKKICQVLDVDDHEYQLRYNDVKLSGQDEENIQLNVPYPDINVDDIKGNKDPLIKAWMILVEKRRQSYYERCRLLAHQPGVDTETDESEMFQLKSKEKSNPNELSRRQILMRMEDDRESHKRSKENLWVVERSGEGVVNEDEFLNYYWNKFEKLQADEETALMNCLQDFNDVVKATFKDKQF